MNDDEKTNPPKEVEKEKENNFNLKVNFVPLKKRTRYKGERRETLKRLPQSLIDRETRGGTIPRVERAGTFMYIPCVLVKPLNHIDRVKIIKQKKMIWATYGMKYKYYIEKYNQRKERIINRQYQNKKQTVMMQNETVIM